MWGRGDGFLRLSNDLPSKSSRSARAGKRTVRGCGVSESMARCMLRKKEKVTLLLNLEKGASALNRKRAQEMKLIEQTNLKREMMIEAWLPPDRRTEPRAGNRRDAAGQPHNYIKASSGLLQVMWLDIQDAVRVRVTWSSSHV